MCVHAEVTEWSDEDIEDKLIELGFQPSYVAVAITGARSKIKLFPRAYYPYYPDCSIGNQMNANQIVETEVKEVLQRSPELSREQLFALLAELFG